MRSESLLTLRSDSLPSKRIESIESSMPDTQINEKLPHSSPALDPLIDKMKREFIARKQKNRSYSQRAYSKFLGLDQSLLSKILSGRWNLSLALRMKIGLKLGMSPLELNHHPETQDKKLDAHKEAFKKIEEEFQFLSHWYSFAILEYLKIPNISYEPTSIARAFGIQTFEVQDTLERLMRFHFIEKSGDQYKLKSPNNIWSDTAITSLARQLLQKQIVEKSLVAIEETHFNHRYHSSLTVSVDQSRMVEFKKKIEEIQRELSEFFQPPSPSMEAMSMIEQETHPLNEVYQLQIGFFPLTKNLKTQENENEKNNK